MSYREELRKSLRGNESSDPISYRDQVRMDLGIKPDTRIKASTNQGMLAQPENTLQNVASGKVSAQKFAASAKKAGETVGDPVKKERSLLQKAGTVAKKSYHAFNDIPAVAQNTMSFGLTDLVERKLGQATKEEQKKRNSGATGIAGQVIGTVQPGAAAEKTAATLLRPLIKNAPRAVQGLARGAGAGAVYGTGSQAGKAITNDDDLSASQRVQSAAIDTTIGGGLGFAAPLVGKAVKAGLSRLRGSRQAVSASTVNEAIEAAPTNSSDGPYRVMPVTTATAAPGERAFVRTLENSDKLTPQVEQGLQASPQRNYERITNAGTVERANQRVAQGIDHAEADLLGKKKYTADDVATGMRLIQELQAKGNAARAVTIAENLASRLTEAGQTVQAASIWNRLTPEGALLAAQRRVNSINEGLLKGQEPVKIDPKQAQFITDAAAAIQASGVSSERAGTVLEIMDRARKGETISVSDRQSLVDFVEDAKKFVNPKKESIPKEVKLPKEMNEPRVRDKVVQFMDQKEQEALARIRARKNRLSSTPFDEWGDYAIVGASKLAKGARAFADFCEQMIRDFGDEIKPHLDHIYSKAQSMLSRSSKSISQNKIDRAESVVRKFAQNASEGSQNSERLAGIKEAVQSAIAKSKSGELTADDVTKIRSLSDEYVEGLPESKPMSEEAKYSQAVSQLAKKLSDVEKEVAPQADSVREIQNLLRRVTNIANEGVEQAAKTSLDNDALEKLAYEMFDRAKPSQAEKIATSYIKKNTTLSDEDITNIRDLAQEVSRLSGKDRQLASQDLQALLNGFEKAGIGRKIAAVQYISMLLNPKTQVRNVVGNELLYRLERLSRVIATPIDIAASKITGGPRTVTFKRGPGVWDNFFQPTKDYWGNLATGVKAGARGVSPEGLTSKYEIQGNAFRSKYNPLTYMEKALGAALQGFDYAAYSRATNQRLSEMAYLDALNSGVKGADNIRNHMETFMVNMDDGVHEIARNYGKYATLQDDTVLARKLMGFRQGLNKVTAGNKDFGLGSLVVPFAKTPANLLLRGLDYSPAGILKAAKQTYDVLRKPNTDLTRADVIDTVSRSIMGTGMGAMAYWLADKGAMFGQSNKDSETRKLQQLAGIKDFQINGSALKRMLTALATGQSVDDAAKIQEGDTLWSYEWAQPSSMPMAIGSNVYQGAKAKQSGLKTTGEAALSGVNTLFNSSVLSGIREAFQIPPGEDNAVKAIGMNLIKQAPSMFTPTVLRNINTYLDDKVRETYSPGERGAILNPAASGIPGVAQNMPQRVDTLGRPQTRPNSFFDVFVSPADRSKYKPSQEAQFVLDLLNETGDSRVAPRAVAKYLSGKDSITGVQRKVDLTPEQFVRLQTLVGRESARRISEINPELPTDKKVEKVIKALDEAGRLGRNELKKELGMKPTK